MRKKYLFSVKRTKKLDVDLKKSNSHGMSQSLRYAFTKLDDTVSLEKKLSTADNFDTGFVLENDF